MALPRFLPPPSRPSRAAGDRAGGSTTPLQPPSFVPASSSSRQASRPCRRGAAAKLHAKASKRCVPSLWARRNSVVRSEGVVYLPAARVAPKAVGSSLTSTLSSAAAAATVDLADASDDEADAPKGQEEAEDEEESSVWEALRATHLPSPRSPEDGKAVASEWHPPVERVRWSKVKKLLRPTQAALVRLPPHSAASPAG